MNGIWWSVCKKFKLILDRFFLFFAKRRKSVEKIDHWKKNIGHRMSKIVKSAQSYSNGHLPYYCSLYYLVCSIHDVDFVRSSDAERQLAWMSLRRPWQTSNKHSITKKSHWAPECLFEKVCFSCSTLFLTIFFTYSIEALSLSNAACKTSLRLIN